MRRTPYESDVTKPGNGERRTRNGERGTGNGEPGTGNGEPGTGNRERGTGNRERESGNECTAPKNLTWRTKEKKREQKCEEVLRL